MSIEAAVRGLWTADPTLAGLVGLRVYPQGGVPQGTARPYGVYSKADREHIMTHDGPVATCRYTMDVTFWADTYAEAQACAARAKAVLLGYAGATGGLDLLGVFDGGESDDEALPQHAEEHSLEGASLSLDLWYR